MSDYYETLGVDRTAGVDEIKKAYRKKALKYHPDRNDGSKESEERFKEATEAYDVLRDTEKRALYDRYGKQGVKGRSASGGPEGFDFSDAIEIFMRDFGGFGGLEDLFGMGGARTRRSAARQGQTVRLRLPLTLHDVVHGSKKTLKVALLDSCEVCDGTGSRDGVEPSPCAACGGAGEERVVQRSVFGQFVSVQPCRVCGGEGRVIEHPCSTCHGEGRVRSERQLEFDVPAGVTSENFLTLKGQGSVGPRGGPRGDVVVMLEVQDDPRFTRDGTDLIMELPITFSQAALGDEVDVPTVDDSARVTVPAGVQSGEVLRLRGLGIPDLRGVGRGDQLVRIHVWTPQDLSGEQEELLRGLRDVESAAPERVVRSGRKGFWSKVKEAFSGA